MVQANIGKREREKRKANKKEEELWPQMNLFGNMVFVPNSEMRLDVNVLRDSANGMVWSWCCRCYCCMCVLQTCHAASVFLFCLGRLSVCNSSFLGRVFEIFQHGLQLTFFGHEIQEFCVGQIFL